MRYLILFVAAVLLASFYSPDAPAQDKAQQKKGTVQEKMLGRWEIVAGVNQGRELSKAEVSGTYVTIKTNSIVTFDRENLARYQAVFDLDETKKPMQINMRSIAKNAPTVSREVENADSTKDVTAAGIVRFDGESKCTLCYALPGEHRPEKFDAPQGSKILLFTLEKKQADPVPNVRANSE